MEQWPVRSGGSRIWPDGRAVLRGPQASPTGWGLALFLLLDQPNSLFGPGLDFPGGATGCGAFLLAGAGGLSFPSGHEGSLDLPFLDPSPLYHGRLPDAGVRCLALAGLGDLIKKATTVGDAVASLGLIGAEIYSRGLSGRRSDAGFPPRTHRIPKPKPKWNLHRHRIGQRFQHRHSGERRNPGNSGECTSLDTGLRRCDEGFRSYRFHKLTHCRLPKQTLGFS